MRFANMHLHSRHSDGELTPLELAQLAKKQGLGALVLTDHDVTTGIMELKEEAEKLDLETMTGAEFSAEYSTDEVHILGYDFNIEHPAMVAFIEKICEMRNIHTLAIFNKLVEEGALKNITWDEVLQHNSGAKWFCNNQVFWAMKSKGLVKDTDYFDYLKATFHSPLATKIKRQMPSTEETIETIKESGGVAILAHPNPIEGNMDYLDDLVSKGISGFEASHPGVPSEIEAVLRDIAHRLNLYTTGGTDHTGEFGAWERFGPNPRLNRKVFNGATAEEFFNLKQRRFG